MRRNAKHENLFLRWSEKERSLDRDSSFPRVISHSTVPRLHVAWISSRSKHSFLLPGPPFPSRALHVNIFLISVNSLFEEATQLIACNLPSLGQITDSVPLHFLRPRISFFFSFIYSFYVFPCYRWNLESEERKMERSSVLFQRKSFKISSLSKNNPFFFSRVLIIQFAFGILTF